MYRHEVDYIRSEHKPYWIIKPKQKKKTSKKQKKKTQKKKSSKKKNWWWVGYNQGRAGKKPRYKTGNYSKGYKAGRKSAKKSKGRKKR